MRPTEGVAVSLLLSARGSMCLAPGACVAVNLSWRHFNSTSSPAPISSVPSKQRLPSQVRAFALPLTAPYLRQRVAVAAYHPATYYGSVDPDLREMGFGELEGQRVAAVKESGAMAAIQGQWATGDLSVRWPGIGGESPEQVVTRGMRGLLVRTVLATPLSSRAADVDRAARLGLAFPTGVARRGSAASKRACSRPWSTEQVPAPCNSSENG